MPALRGVDLRDDRSQPTEGNGCEVRMAGRWLLATIALLCAGCQVAYFGVINVGTQAELVAPRDGVVYDTALRLGLDVHRPEAVERAATPSARSRSFTAGGSRSA
jgi:hypothetical protein